MSTRVATASCEPINTFVDRLFSLWDRNGITKFVLTDEHAGFNILRIEKGRINDQPDLHSLISIHNDGKIIGKFSATGFLHIVLSKLRRQKIYDLATGQTVEVTVKTSESDIDEQAMWAHRFYIDPNQVYIYTDNEYVDSDYPTPPRRMDAVNANQIAVAHVEGNTLSLSDFVSGAPLSCAADVELLIPWAEMREKGELPAYGFYTKAFRNSKEGYTTIADWNLIPANVWNRWCRTWRENGHSGPAVFQTPHVYFENADEV
ncbi:hypothetical protein IL306_007714 [Fusarium sp. DS 682]|nr:hypothetical protein IL306_007714 [Fusarium sp. DS 682]